MFLNDSRWTTASIIDFNDIFNSNNVKKNSESENFWKSEEQVYYWRLSHLPKKNVNERL